MLEVQVQLQRAELGCVTRAEFVPVVDVNGLFLFSSHFPPSFSLYSFASHLFEVPSASGQVEVCLEAGETLFLCRNHSCWVCLPCCWGDLSFLRSILFWKQLVPLGKQWLFGAVKPGQHRSLGEFCQPGYWHQGCPGVQAPVVSVEFGSGCLSISFPLLVNSSLDGILFCAALQSAPHYCSCIFPHTSSGDCFGCGAFPPTRFVVQGWFL